MPSLTRLSKLFQDGHYTRRQLVSVVFHDGEKEMIKMHSLDADLWEASVWREWGRLEPGFPKLRCPVGRGIWWQVGNCCNLCIRWMQVLKSIKIPYVRTVHLFAFAYCVQLSDVEFGSDLERIDIKSFYNCLSLQRITIPLKENLFPFETDFVQQLLILRGLRRCTKLSHLCSWRGGKMKYIKKSIVSIRCFQTLTWTKRPTQ